MFKRKMRWLIGDLKGLSIDLYYGLKEASKWLVIFALVFVVFAVLLPIVF